MATIRDVAQLAGVSITTVSHVLNGTRPVSANGMSRVLQAVQDLGYQPNAVARSLRMSETHMFGMIVPDNSNPYFAEVARSIEDSAFDLGYSVILCNSDEDPAKEEAYLNLLIEKRVDGIAFVATGASENTLEPARARGLPVVVVDREIEGSPWPSVLVQNGRGAREAVDHLARLGHRHIGCISGPRNLGPSSERVSGYREALRRNGLPVEPKSIVEGDFHAEGGYRTMSELLEREPKLTAVFACNDMMAVGALRAMREHGRSVPDDIALVGFDDIALASYTQPALTTIAQPYQELGRRVAQLLAKAERADAGEQERIRLKPKLVVRESCGAMRGAARSASAGP